MVKVIVTYCGGWGYGSRYNRLKDALEAAVPGVEVEGVRQSNRTGDFEVEVAGQLVHSKKGGAGFPDNEDKVNKIVEAIKAAQ